MARRNFVRSLCAVSLFAAWMGTGGVAAAAPAGEDLPPVVVKVHADRFEGPGGDGTVYARSAQSIRFELVDPADTHHTVTIEREDCETRYPWLCEQRFDSQRDETVDFRFSAEGEYRFYDRYAREAGRVMTGRFIIGTAPPPIPPSTTTTTTSTAPPTTTPTTAPTTTTSTAPSTTTTAPGAIRPFLVPDPPSTTTTTAATAAPPPPGGVTTAPAGDKDKNRDKDKGKSKAAATGTPTTGTPEAPGAVPPEGLFDPASLTPGPVVMPAEMFDVSSDESAVGAAALAELLDPASAGSEAGDNRLTLYAAGALGLFLLGCAVWGWHHRSSRYFPA